MAGRSTQWRSRSIYALAAIAVLALAWAMLRPRPIDVDTGTVTRGALAVTVAQQGEVRVRDRYVVTVPVAGRLARVQLRDGDPVIRGQAVALLQPAPLDQRQREAAEARRAAARAHVREAQQEVTHVEAELAQATRDRERAEKLVAQKFVSPEAAERARTVEATARSSVEAARSREAAARYDADAAAAALIAANSAAPSGRYVSLEAPADGRVLRVLEQSERTLPAGTPVMVIGDPSRFEVVADFLSTDAVKIPPAAPAYLENWGGARALEGRVRLVEPYAFTKVSALGVEEKRVNVVIDFIDPPGPLGDGYRVEARVVLWSAASVLKAPASALFRHGAGWAVFVVRADRVERRDVEVGQHNASEAEILGGLAEGDPVVLYPGSDLDDGARVRVRSP